LSLLACIACAAHASTPAKLIRPKSAPCIQKPDVPDRWGGYNDQPVDACLGPIHYRIPANYFDDQMGPDFQGNFSLMVQWPQLLPLPPGKGQQRDMETVYKGIDIYPDYVDRVPIETLLENFIAIKAWLDPAYADEPSSRLDLRDKRPQRFGLTPYFVNREKFVAFWKRREQIQGYKPDVRLENEEDWYLAHDAQGRLSTLIQCDSHLKPDGLVIQGDRLLMDGSSTVAGCKHEFVIEEDKLNVSISYRRIFLQDWKRFEDRARELLRQYRVR